MKLFKRAARKKISKGGIRIDHNGRESEVGAVSNAIEVITFAKINARSWRTNAKRQGRGEGRIGHA